MRASVEYTSYDFKPEIGLGDQLARFILSRESWVKKLWLGIPASEKGEKKKLLYLRILAHLRDHEKITPDNLKTLVRGTHLRKEDTDEVIKVLMKHRLINRSNT